MKDYNITIGNIAVSTDMIEEDVLRLRMGLDPKPQDKADDSRKEDEICESFDKNR